MAVAKITTRTKYERGILRILHDSGVVEFLDVEQKGQGIGSLSPTDSQQETELLNLLGSVTSALDVLKVNPSTHSALILEKVMFNETNLE
ncbi:MAG TPA: hypothetical protein VJ044_15675, partial [Candidatus Hodarchaeales archaeon]|nr:hypothetical protein [Candidatus Hodarchaeales archaeon]